MTANRNARLQSVKWSWCFRDLPFSFSDLGGLEHELGDVAEESALAEVDLF